MECSRCRERLAARLDVTRIGWCRSLMVVLVTVDLLGARFLFSICSFHVSVRMVVAMLLLWPCAAKVLWNTRTISFGHPFLPAFLLSFVQALRQCTLFEPFRSNIMFQGWVRNRNLALISIHIRYIYLASPMTKNTAEQWNLWELLEKSPVSHGTLFLADW